MRNIAQTLLKNISYQTRFFGVHSFQYLNIENCCLSYLTKQAHRHSLLIVKDYTITFFPPFLLVSACQISLFSNIKCGVFCFFPVRGILLNSSIYVKFLGWGGGGRGSFPLSPSTPLATLLPLVIKLTLSLSLSTFVITQIRTKDH